MRRMRFLIDNSLSPRFADCLAAAHVRALGPTATIAEMVGSLDRAALSFSLIQKLIAAARARRQLRMA